MFSFFKKKKKTISENKNSLLVTHIEESDQLNVSLGITEERRHELVNLMSKYENCNSFSDLFERVSKEVVHANELAYICFLIGRVTATAQNPLEMLLTQIFKR